MFLILILIGYGLEYALDYGLNTLSGSVYEEWKNIVDGDINADLVVMGSSRGMVSYDPLIMQQNLGYSCYNLSFDAASYNLQHAKLDAYLLSNKMPEVIIQNIDITHFSKSEVIPFESQFVTILNSKNVLEIYEETPSTLEKFRFKGVSKYTVDNRMIKLSISNLLRMKPDYLFKKNGYKAVLKKYEPDLYNLKRLKSLDINASLNGLNEIFDYYQDDRFENTRIYFVWAPEYKSRRLLTKEISKRLKEILENKIIDNQKKVFLDYQEDEIGDSPKYFYDSFHLNKKGSQKFTQKLILKLKTL